MKRSAFTLFELLVVVAIIPVFCVSPSALVKPSNLPGVSAPDTPCGQFITVALSGALSTYFVKWGD
ncbi:MAG: type II secretion system protein [Fimbriimonas sp.]|nr:type II secretion system protein [Fimbriimonas sp.]